VEVEADCGEDRVDAIAVASLEVVPAHPLFGFDMADDGFHSGCDNASAFVPLHGVGHGADANWQGGIGAVPAFQYPQGLIAPADGVSASGA
jgi:hypothetical protein